MTLATRRRRLDAELVRRSLVTSRQEARLAVDAGLVTVDGAPALKPARQVSADQQLHVVAPAREFVSRGGHKLAHALDVFGIDPDSRHCLDAGVSTGGFTDVLLQRGAVHVRGYDVGYGQVHERIRTDPRVTVHERTNVRELTAADVPAPHPSLVVADLSFVSLTLVLPVLRELAEPDAVAVVLVKPQFEAGRGHVARGGVVRDPAVWADCLHRVASAAAVLDWPVVGATASPLTGPAGNVEFLLHLAGGRPTPAADHVQDVGSGPGVLLEGAVEEGRGVRAAAGRGGS